jgi:F-type H+-transporting ATPase subunit epsilon
MRCIVVTPEETVLEGEASFVALPLFDGEIGIARGHSPMIGRLGFGELRIRSADDTARYYVDGGFVQVADNLVSVLTNRAIPFEAVDGDAAQEQLSEALGRTATGEDQMAIRDRSLAQARAQLRIASRPR